MASHNPTFQVATQGWSMIMGMGHKRDQGLKHIQVWE
jgi:hypothetical protein